MFQEILVVDYITDYTRLSAEQLEILKKGLINPEFLDNCPNGTIVGIPIGIFRPGLKKIYFPFFSHIIMPVKAGERAWAFDQRSGAASYWLSRKVQNISANDLNFTQDDRARIYPTLKLKSTSSDDPAAILSEKFYDAGVSVLNLESVRSGSISREEFVGEPVAPLISKSIDLTIQGSNGTAIRMSCDEGLGSGTIDIVSGIAEKFDKKSILNSDGYEETIKPGDNSVDLSANDLSRMTISQAFNSDSYYSLPGEDSDVQPTVCLKSEGIRIVAKNDLKIVVGDVADPSSIIIKSNGDIIITPSSLGVIKLGGEDATGALIATQTAVVTAGIVTGSPITDTAGGIIGAEGFPQTGVFATKILVKV